MYLLDSDVLIDLLRSYDPAVRWVNSISDEELLVPGLAAMELIQGCRNKPEKRRVERALSKFGIIWPTSETCDHALALFSECYLRDGIGIIDALVAQMAVDLGVPLMTFNSKHYACVAALNALQPYSRP